MSLQGAADAVKEGVQAVAEKLQSSSITEGNNATADNDAAQKLLLDEATGEMVSKSEHKRRLKLREKEAKKAEREAARPPPAVGKRKAANPEEEEAKLNPNVCPVETIIQA